MVDNESGDGALPINIRFIRDVPADDDFFNTHTRVADAIVRAIEANNEIKVIGLLGRWGSGKSTVANKIVEMLNAREGSGFRVFTYDAWLHQSDPLRRSFLESLIGSLVTSKDIDPTRWSKELKELSRPVEDTHTIATPVFSWDARWIGLSLLAVPIGIGFINLDGLKEAFGQEQTALGLWTLVAAPLLILTPVFTWAGLYLARRPWNRFLNSEDGLLKKAFWQTLDEDGQPTSPLRLFEEGRTQHTKTQTFRAMEPTSLEFGRMFQKIMREAKGRGSRMVILIDNLDRVAASEALGMWATIRSFFLASHQTEDLEHEAFHPTVILPIDRHAVEDLFVGGDDNGQAGRERARSFMDKTFDVTFEVTEPVSSDWRAFLAQQMEWMFEAAYETRWGFWTRRLFESQLARQQAQAAADSGRPPAIVTPREINKLLNRIGALYLQWADAGIPVEVMALYVIRRDDIDAGLLQFLQAQDVEIDEVAPDWKRQLAALHYGVALDKAAQVLLAEPIRAAIIRRDEGELKTLSSIPGFGETFEYATANLPGTEAISGPFEILANAVFLLNAVTVQGADWASNSWRNLLSTYFVRSEIPALRPTDIGMVKLLCPHVPTEARTAFLSTSAGLMARALSQPRRADDEIAQAAEDLIAFARANGLAAPVFELEMEPSAFIVRLSEVAGRQTLWSQLRTNHTGIELGEALGEAILAEGPKAHLSNAVLRLAGHGGEALYRNETKIDFSALAEKANQLIRSPESYGGNAMAGLIVLVRLSYFRTEGKDLLVALIDEGLVAALLNDRVAQKDWAAVAEIVAILLWRRQRFEAPTEFHWFQYPQRDPDHLRKIVDAIKRYFSGALVPILWGARRANLLNSSFFESIIGFAVENDALGNFDAKPVLKELYSYQWAVPSALRHRFLDQVDRRSNLMTALEEAPLGRDIVEAAKYLESKGGKIADQAKVLVRTRVQQAGASEWGEALKSAKEPFSMGLSLAQSEDLTFGRKSGLYEALQNAISLMAADAGKDVQGRWFKLLTLIKARNQKTLMQALGEALNGAAPDQTLHVFKAGGTIFLKGGGFASRPELSIRNIIIPQLAKKAGRDWLKENRDDLANWVQKAKPEARAELLKVLEGLLRSRQEDRRYTGDMLVTKWGLKQNN